MSIIYSGYVYIWYDTKSKFFYIGGHKGKISDSYVCSNKPMLRAYNLRPETFKFKVLEYVFGDKIELRKCEQKWLDKIKDSELMNTTNVNNKTCRYYNVKKQSTGGNGSANKGKSHKSWNKGYTKIESILRKEGKLSFYPLDKPKIKIKETKIKQIKKYKYKEKNCLCCNLSFFSKNKNNIYCSRKCRIENKIKKSIKIEKRFTKIKKEYIHECILCKKLTIFKKKKSKYCYSCRATLAAKQVKNNHMKNKTPLSIDKLKKSIIGKKLQIRENGTKYWKYTDKSEEILLLGSPLDPN